MNIEDLKQEDYIEIGYIHSPQGVKGESFVVFFSDDVPWLEEWVELLISPKDQWAQREVHLIDKKRPHQKQGKKGYAVTISSWDRTASERVSKWTVWLHKDHLTTEEEGEAIFLHEVLGFEVYDEARGWVGPVVGVESQLMQDHLVVRYQDVDYQIPFVEAFIIELNFDEKKILMDIPQGLLEEL